jgi:hypothetical protein
MKKFNTHNFEKIFFNHNVARMFLLMHDWKSIKEVSKIYDVINLEILKKENPEKFHIKLNKKIGRGERILTLIKKEKFYTNPLVQKYCTIFKNIGWVEEAPISKTFPRRSKKGKLHYYTKADMRMRINLSQVVLDYIKIVREVQLNDGEEKILKLMFSLPTLSDFILHEMLYDEDIFPIPKDDIATFAEKSLFRFLYIATNVKTSLDSEDIRIIKEVLKIYKNNKIDEKTKIEKIDEKIKDLPPATFCPIIFKIIYFLSRELVDKIIQKVLRTYLREVVINNLIENRDKLIVFI